MAKPARVPETRQITGVQLPPYVQDALADADDWSLVEKAAAAWGAEHQHAAQRATVDLARSVQRALGVELELVNPEFFDRPEPRECAGGTVDGLAFGFRNNVLAHVVVCAHEGCDREVFGPINGIVLLGRALSLIEDDKVDGEPWACGEHRKKGRS